MKPPSAPQTWQTVFGTFKLSRYPAKNGDTQLAWSAADDLLLEEVARLDISGPQVLVVNDPHGALCVALQPAALWTDSALSALALKHNEHINHRIETPVVWSTDAPLSAKIKPPNVVVLRVPKHLSFFEHQLTNLARELPVGTTILAAGMDKHLSSHTAAILERCIGPTQRFPGRRKARLFSAQTAARPADEDLPRASYYCEPINDSLQSLPNVFSKDKLDMGSRLLMEQFPTLAPARTVIDLACGNGVLGLTAFKLGLARALVFCDESAMAIRSAQLNATQCFPDDVHKFSFHQGDGLRMYSGELAELILCNPPFHLDHTVDAFLGPHLLQQCVQRLSPDGRLCLVGNRHLNYGAELAHTFARVEKIASNSKFNVILAYKN